MATVYEMMDIYKNGEHRRCAVRNWPEWAARGWRNKDQEEEAKADLAAARAAEAARQDQGQGDDDE